MCLLNKTENQFRFFISRSTHCNVFNFTFEIEKKKKKLISMLREIILFDKNPIYSIEIIERGNFKQGIIMENKNQTN